MKFLPAWCRILKNYGKEVLKLSVGRNIKKLRSKYSLLQKDLAVIAGVSDKTVSAWEKDRIDPRMSVIQKIADHFGIKKSDIIEPSDITELHDTMDVTSEETELITSYRELGSEGKKFLKGIIGQLKNFNVTSATL